MKKLILMLMISSTVWFTACGDNNEEAKALLERILRLVGIPQDIIVNICQDANLDGFCGTGEVQTKITIKKGDTAEKILEKVTLDENNQYFLANYNPAHRILLELQNQESFQYDDGKFTFNYEPQTQELSILQAMVDAGYLTQNDVTEIKSANAVDDFYFVLLRDTYSNMNRLRAKGLNNKEAVALSLKEMADELLLSGISDELTEKLNNCGDDQACIDKVLDEVSSGLLIEQDEAREIAILKNKPFITKWKTDNIGTSNNKLESNYLKVSEKNQIRIPTTGEGYNYDVVWGDGTNDRNVTGDITHSYAVEGNYTVEIYGEFPQIYFGKEEETDSKKIVSILKWGDIEWKSMNRAFFACSNLKGEADDIPNLSKVTNLEAMFAGASLFNQNISDWNVSSVTSMKSMFSGATTFNQNLGNWDIANVTNMSAMFSRLTLSLENYNSLLTGWSQQNVKYGVTLDAGNSQYSDAAEEQRSSLINRDGWTIRDGGCNGTCYVAPPYNPNYQ